MEEEEEDIENIIPVTNLQYSQGSAEVRIKTVKKDDNGFTETKIERLKIQQQEQTKKQNFIRSGVVENIICLSIEDLNRATAFHDIHWKIFNDVYFRRALIYGKATVQNIFGKDGKTCYKLLIDDGSAKIEGIYSVSKEMKTEASNLAGRLTMEKNKLKRKEEVGANIKGKFFPPESPECKKLLESCKVLHNSIAKNINARKKNFQQGPLNEKALVLGNLFVNFKTGKVQLNIIDIDMNDSIELAWKRQLNKLYLKKYLKGS